MMKRLIILPLKFPQPTEELTKFDAKQTKINLHAQATLLPNFVECRVGDCDLSKL